MFYQEISDFSLSLYKGVVRFLPAPTTCKNVLSCFIILDNLREVFICSIAPDSMPIMFGFSIFSGCWVIIFDQLTNLLFLSSKMIYLVL